MQKEIGFYNDDTTPYKYSYSPYTKMWYEDEYEQMPEPNVPAEKIAHFKLDDELGLCTWMNGKKYCDYEEEKVDFENYIKYVCDGENYGFDACDVSILPNSKILEIDISISIEEFIDLEEFIKNIDNKNYSFLYCKDFSGMKFFAWKKENNKIRLLIQRYGTFEIGYIDYDQLCVEYDMKIDKDEFVNEFMRVINKYKNLVIKKIEEYENKNNITFSNPNKFKYLDYWIKR